MTCRTSRRAKRRSELSRVRRAETQPVDKNKQGSHVERQMPQVIDDNDGSRASEKWTQPFLTGARELPAKFGELVKSPSPINLPWTTSRDPFVRLKIVLTNPELNSRESGE